MPKKEVNERGYIAISDSDKLLSIKEEMQGQVLDMPVTFPKQLGAKHPFEFKDVEDLITKYGVVGAILDKKADSIVSDFRIKVKNPNAQILIDEFIHSNNLPIVIREWVKEGLGKGNGFLEIDLDDNKVRVLNANGMYVKRRRNGEVVEYNQWNRNLGIFDKDSRELITFTPNQIAHLTFNKIPNEPYGRGIVMSSEKLIENIIKNDMDLQKIMSRKAGAPYHIKVGQPGVVTPKNVVDAIKANLQYLRNTVEWVTDGDIEIKAVDFGPLGQSLMNAQMYNFRMLLAGMGMPEVLMGSGQLNEGIGQVQLEGYDRDVKTKQTQVGNILEEKLIRPLLKANGLDERPEFIWDMPSESDNQERITQIQGLLGSMVQTSSAMKAALELELAKLMDLTELIDILPEPQEALDKANELEQQNQNMQNNSQNQVPVKPKISPEAKAEKKINQPEMPGVKPNAKLKAKITLTESEIKSMSLREWVNIQETSFNYADYVTNILSILKTDNFDNLKGITEQDIENGMLSDNQIVKLRLILNTGFRENQTMGEIEDSIRNNLGLKDLKTSGSVINADNRAENIARTETVKLANQGLVQTYRDNGINQVRFLASISSRTCEDCESLDGQIFNMDDLNEGENQPPIHNCCRCGLVAVTE